MSQKPAYLRPLTAEIKRLAEGMDPRPVAQYIQYKLVRAEDPLDAVAYGHQDDEETEATDSTLERLADLITDRVCDGGSVFDEMEPGGFLHDCYGGPQKFVREVVLVFDLNDEERAELDRLRELGPDDDSEDGEDD